MAFCAVLTLKKLLKGAQNDESACRKILVSG